MRRFRMATLLGSSVLLLSLSASAQYGPDRGYPDRDYREYRDRDYRDHRGAGYSRSVDPEGGIFARTASDLDRAASSQYYRGGDRRRIENARRDLWDFQKRWREGRYDRGELDEAIGNVQKVINMRYLDYQDRAALEQDVQQLREFRASQNDRGYDRGSYGRRY